MLRFANAFALAPLNFSCFQRGRWNEVGVHAVSFSHFNLFQLTTYHAHTTFMYVHIPRTDQNRPYLYKFGLFGTCTYLDQTRTDLGMCTCHRVIYRQSPVKSKTYTTNGTRTVYIYMKVPTYLLAQNVHGPHFTTPFQSIKNFWKLNNFLLWINFSITCFMSHNKFVFNIKSTSRHVFIEKSMIIWS